MNDITKDKQEQKEYRKDLTISCVLWSSVLSLVFLILGLGA